MHSDELWQLYYKNGEPIVGQGWKSARDNPEKSGGDEIVGVAVVFLYRFHGGEIEFLWQKRSDEVSRFPGYYDISAGGHINLGESLPEAAIRETREEIGVDITAEDLEFVTMRPFNKNRFAWVWGVDWTDRTDDFHFNDHEVSEVKWVPYSKMREFVKTKAKPPLQNDELTFAALDEWIKMHGYMQPGKDKASKLNNYAFIDGNNLYLGTKNQGIKLDYRKFRLYLKNKLGVEKAFLFIGKDKSRTKLYTQLKESGYELVFKPAVFYTGANGDRAMKGNVDAELVLHSAAIEYNNYDKAVVVTGDGDFACLMNFLKRDNKLGKIITPTANFSLLLKPYIKDILPIGIIKDGIQK